MSGKLIIRDIFLSPRAITFGKINGSKPIFASQGFSVHSAPYKPLAFGPYKKPVSFDWSVVGSDGPIKWRFTSYDLEL
jgi:hypothetical protein